MRAKVNESASSAVREAQFSLVHIRDLVMLLVPAVLLALAAFWLALQFVGPPPPKLIAIATGGEAGAYYTFGKRYAEALRRSGITLDVRPTRGTVENLSLLHDRASGIDVALVQGGIAKPADAAGLLSVGRMFAEPLWVFHRANVKADRLADLSGRLLAIGPEGSGNRALAEALLAANRLTTAGGTRLSPLGGAGAAEALERGEVDAVFLSLAPQAPLVQRLLRAENVRLLSFEQADAYTKTFPYLTRLTLPKGVVDLARSVPEKDIQLVAPVAALVVRSDLHPSLVALLAEAAREVHGPASLFARARQYPEVDDPEFAMSPDAERYYEQGPTALKRFLPFWLATFIERSVVMIVPILTVLIPLIKVLPALYRWQIRRRMLHYYGELKDIEARLATAADRADLVAELDRVDQAVSALPMPIGFAQDFYELRTHIELVRQRLAGRALPVPAPAAQVPSPAWT